IFGAVLLPVIIFGGMPIIILAYLLASIALYELLKMRNLSLFSIPGIISLLLLWVFLLPKEFQSILDDLNYTKIEVALFGVLLFLTYT
ncbi:hypothetical protein OSK10_27495, partial [Escherichia coli]|nr:hypothetical protein [Escherichia coli]